MPKKPSKSKTPSKKVPQPVKEYIHKAIDSNKSLRQFMYPSAAQEVTVNPVFLDLTDIDVAGAGIADNPILYRSQAEIELQALNISGFFAPKSGGVADAVCRLVVFRWKGDSASDPPTAAALFGSNFTRNWASPVGFDRIETAKFQLLWDRTWHLGPQTGSASVPKADKETILVKKTLYLNKLPKVTYDSNTGSTGGKNHLYVMYIGNSGSGTDSSQMYIDFFLRYLE